MGNGNVEKHIGSVGSKNILERLFSTYTFTGKYL
jgi:hypothetical protein